MTDAEALDENTANCTLGRRVRADRGVIHYTAHVLIVKEGTRDKRGGESTPRDDDKLEIASKRSGAHYE